jgi:hypothetical protein
MIFFFNKLFSDDYNDYNKVLILYFYYLSDIFANFKKK